MTSGMIMTYAGLRACVIEAVTTASEQRLHQLEPAMD